MKRYEIQMSAGFWRGFVAILCLTGTVAASEKGDAHFFFVQMTDTHWGARDGLRLTQRVVEAINELPMPIAFVVHTGDVVADAIGDEDVVEKGLASMRQLKVPVHYVPGNHDIAGKKAKSEAALFKKYFGPLNSRTDYRGVACLFLNTEPLSKGDRAEGNTPMAWLAEQLKATANRPVLLFQHMAPTSETLSDKDYPSWTEDARREWQTLLREHTQVKAVVAGHLHKDELHWIGNVPVYVSAPVARFWDRQPSYRLYEYEDGRLGYWTVYLDKTKPGKE